MIVFYFAVEFDVTRQYVEKTPKACEEAQGIRPSVCLHVAF